MPGKDGRFQPGESGNMKGRPPGNKAFAALILAELELEDGTNRAVVKLLGHMESEDEKVSMMAITLLLAYGYGRPTMQVDAKVDLGARVVMHFPDNGRGEPEEDDPE